MYQIVNNYNGVTEIIGYCCELQQISEIVQEKYKNILKKENILATKSFCTKIKI